METSSQLRSKKHVKVARVSVRVNNHLQAKMTKKTSQKPPTTRNLRKIRGSKLCSQCSKVNEELNQNGPVEVPDCGHPCHSSGTGWQPVTSRHG
ncbi:TPA: hypothetical protein BOS_26442 [Bos taurus]|nr:TPA: hypothetical protein BOS_26442 [Bos taurus]